MIAMLIIVNAIGQRCVAAYGRVWLGAGVAIAL